MLDCTHVFVAAHIREAVLTALIAFGVVMPGVAADSVSAAACEIGISPDSLPRFSDEGGSSQVVVTASADCGSWSATSDWWISMPDAGATPLTFQVEQNDSVLPRIGHILVGDQSLSILQSGAPGLIFREMASD